MNLLVTHTLQFVLMPLLCFGCSDSSLAPLFVPRLDRCAAPFHITCLPMPYLPCIGGRCFPASCHHADTPSEGFTLPIVIRMVVLGRTTFGGQYERFEGDISCSGM